MAKERKSTATPRLRFPQFRDRSGWTSTELRELAELVTERVGAADCTPYTVTTGVGLVSQQEKLGRTIAGNSLRNYIVLQRNDFAYNKSATKAFPQGYIARYVGEERAAVPNSIFTCFRVDGKTIDPIYLDYLFSSNLHGKWLRSYITVGARAHGSLNVNDDDLMALPVPMPDGSTSLKEQKKIAECLTSLDGIIAAHRRKLEVLSAYKRGLMQQLFPSEGETMPRLRFPEFRHEPEWKETTLGQIVDFQSGGTPSKTNPAFWNGSIPWVSAKDMKRLFLDNTEDHITTAAVDDGAKRVPPGTVLMLIR
jgi:type I restriction enzyme, S subunit